MVLCGKGHFERAEGGRMTKNEHDITISNLEFAIRMTRCPEDVAICKALILVIEELYGMQGKKEDA
jgi:hypothetical protein